jgi:hypothetical protein
MADILELYSLQRFYLGGRNALYVRDMAYGLCSFVKLYVRLG